RAQWRDRGFRSIFLNGHLCRAAEQDEHGIAFRSFFNYALAAPEMIEVRLFDQIVDLTVGQTLEKQFTPKNRARFFMAFRYRCRWATFQLQCAYRKRNVDSLAFQFVPDIGADGVVGLIDSGMVAHVIFYFVDHGGVPKIDQEH